MRYKTWTETKLALPDNRTGSVKILCPLCSHKRSKTKEPCVYVNFEAGVFKCYNAECGYSGHIGNTNQEFRPEDVQAEWAMPEEGTKEQLYTWFKEKRQISKETVDLIQAKLSKKYFPSLNQEAICIAIPSFGEDGLVEAIYYRGPDKSSIQAKGGKRILNGINFCVESTTIYIVEGHFDRAAMLEAGYHNTASVPNGAPSPNTVNYDNYFTFLKEHEDIISNCEKVFIAVDMDTPGRKLKEELARRIGKEKCFVVEFTEGCNDANDVLKKHGKEELIRCIEDAKPFPIEGLFHADEFEEPLRLLYYNKQEKGRSTGFKNLDEFFTLGRQQLTIITGAPGSGKSEFVDTLAYNLGIEYGNKTGIFSAEHLPYELHIRKMIEKKVGLPFHENFGTRMTWKAASEALKWVNDHFIYLYPKTPSPENIITAIKGAVYREGIDTVILDPWGRIKTNVPEGSQSAVYIEQILIDFFNLARTAGLHIFLVAHTTKLNYDKDSGKLIRPKAYNVAHSAGFYNVADNIMVVYRNSDKIIQGNHCTEIHVEKVKNKYFGTEDMCYMGYKKSIGTYFPLTPDTEDAILE